MGTLQLDWPGKLRPFSGDDVTTIMSPWSAISITNGLQAGTVCVEFLCIERQCYGYNYDYGNDFGTCICYGYSYGYGEDESPLYEAKCWSTLLRTFLPAGSLTTNIEEMFSIHINAATVSPQKRYSALIMTADRRRLLWFSIHLCVHL